MSFAADDLRFAKSYTYSDVDFGYLSAQYGNEFIQRLCFHIMALEALPFVSFQPEELDLGPFSRFHTVEFEQLWRTIFLKAGAQWRYENNLPEYRGPRLLSGSTAARASVAVTGPGGPVDTLCFCGGGKDSLAAMKLFESAGLSFSAYSYSHPAYGSPAKQFELVDSLLDSTTTAQRHRAEISDEFTRDANYTRFGLESPLCAETPISLFGAVFEALQHGYQRLALGNERSSEEPNLRWNQTGELINHQWGKSLEAELLISRYIRQELVSNLHYFSVLKPLHDPVIFHLLRRYPEAVKRTHSCNHQKPWCRRCVKCAYVGLGFAAYLSDEVSKEMVPGDFFDAPANQLCFRQLLGLDAHKPFECVGESGETRLAFELCHARGRRGLGINLYLSHARVHDAVHLAQTYTDIALHAHSLPPALCRSLLPLMLKAGRESFDYISSVCGFDRQLALVIGGDV